MVRFLWRPAHIGIKGNEKADFVAKKWLLAFWELLGYPYRDFIPLLERDFESWKTLNWPYTDIQHSRNKYYIKVNYKTKRPWFRGIEASCRHINTITRLRTSDICTGEHFARMRWNLPLGCECGAQYKYLNHLFKKNKILSLKKINILKIYLLSQFWLFFIDTFFRAFLMILQNLLYGFLKIFKWSILFSWSFCMFLGPKWHKKKNITFCHY